MKKFREKINLVFLCVISFILVGVLGACSFKDVDIDFTTEQITCSIGQTVDLSDLVSLTNLEPGDVVFKISDSSYASISGSTLTTQKAGRTYVYATYSNSIFATLSLCVKDVFSTPTNFVLTENSDGETATLTWDAVSGYFSGDSELTTAQEYLISYTQTTYDENETPTTTTHEETVSTNSIVLAQGFYELSVKAVGTGNFDSSAACETQEVYVGYMTRLTQTDFSWDDGTLSWTAISGATYSVYVDGAEFATNIEANSVDLSQFFEESDAISVQVKVSDTNTNVNEKKYSSWSETISIEKLAASAIGREDGALSVGLVEGAAEYSLQITDSNGTTQTLDLTEMIFSLQGYDAGLYSLCIVAKPAAVENGSAQMFYHSVTDAIYVYKLPTVTLSGASANEAGGTTLNLASSTSLSLPFSAKVMIDSEQVATISAGASAAQFSYTLASGSKTLTATLCASSQDYELDGKSVYVLDSDESASIEICKLSDFSSEVTHAYSGEVSTLTFDAVEGATGYVLLRETSTGVFEEVSSALFEISTSENVTITFTGKIQDLFDAVDQKFSFKIVTTSADDTLTINSYITKTLTLLAVPESVANSASSSSYAWSGSASKFEVTYYSLTKDQYSTAGFDVSGLSGETVVCEENSYDFGTGYYYIQIRAISSDENSEISSVEVLSEKFYKSEQLAAPTFSFGFNEDYVATSQLEVGSGYFLQITTGENVGSYSVAVDGSALTVDAATGTTIFKFSEDFSAETDYTISVTAIGADETLYLSSTAATLVVTRLASVTADELVIDAYVQNPTLTVSTTQNGVSAVKIYVDDATEPSDSGSSITLDSTSDFSLTFVLEGSTLTGTLFTPTGGSVFLSASSTISFERIAEPSELSYYDGDLVFERTDVPDAFVLSVSGEANNVTLSIDVVLFTTSTEYAKVIFSGTTMTTGTQSGAVLTSSTNWAIDVEKVVSLIKTYAASAYAQMSSIRFAVYASNEIEVTDADSTISLASLSALNAAGTQRYVEIGKLSTSSLTYENGMLTWTEVGSNLAEKSETEYVLYNASGVVATLKTTSYETSTDGTYYVVVKNPYYLESAQSNNVTLSKLAAVSSVTLTDSATLTIKSSSTGVEAFEVNGTSITGTTISDLSTLGTTLTIKAIGKTVTNSKTGDITYYLDSESASWSIALLSSLVPADTSISVDNNTISWSALTVSNDNFEYYLIFEDENGNSEHLSTTSTSLTWTSGSELCNKLEALSEGDITVTLYAHVKSHSIAAGNVIYYASSQTILTTNECNYAQYINEDDEPQTATITKYSAPNVTAVDFVGEVTKNDEEEITAVSNSPEIQITFTGNYGATGNFYVCISDENGDSNFTISLSETSSDSGTYVLTIATQAASGVDVVYNFTNRLDAGESFDVKIYALNTNDTSAFPSTAGQVTITRASELSLSFGTADVGYNSTVSVSGGITGEIVLVLEFDDGDLTTKTIYQDLPYNSTTLDFSSYLSDFKSGATVTVTAFARSVGSDLNNIYLASKTTELSGTVLATVTSVTSTASGFSVVTSTGSGTLTYVITYSDEEGSPKSESVKVESGESWNFEIPAAFTSGNFEFSIQVFCAGYVCSYINKLTYSVSRLDSVGEVSIDRVDGSQQMSWSAVTNANGYLVEVFLSSDLGTAICSDTISDTSILLDDLFSSSAILTTLTADAQVTISLTALGGKTVESVTYTSSEATQFEATILGNATDSTKFSVDERGILTFTGATENAYYLFINNSVTTTWAAVGESGILDSSEIDGGYSYQISIRYRGDESATSNSQNITLDSSYTYKSSTSMLYTKTPDIESISASGSNDTLLFETGVSGSTLTFFVGLDKDALSSSKFATFSVQASEGSKTYEVTLSKILTLLTEKGLLDGTANDSLTLCFWVLHSSNMLESELGRLVSSMKSVTISNGSDIGFVAIVKGVRTDATNESTANYVNNYALFKYDTNTVGIYLTATSENGDVQSKVFFAAAEMKQENIGLSSEVWYYETTDTYAYFVINLTEFFEENLSEYSGYYVLNFMRISKSDTTLLAVSEEIEETIYRMASVNSISISYGDLHWQSGDAGSEFTQTYYIYLSSSDDMTDSSLFSTPDTYYEGSKLAWSTSDYCYVAVRAVDTTNASVICSQMLMKSESVRKIKLSSDSLVLENGELYFNFAPSSDTLLALYGNYYAELSEGISSYDVTSFYFDSPFSFTIEQYNSDAISVRFQFIGDKTYTIDVPISYVLRASDATKAIWNAFSGTYSFGETNNQIISKVINADSGLGTAQTIFDEFFESVQSGAYTVKYCVMGVSTNFNSSWETYGSTIYVTSQPTTTFSMTSDDSTNAFKVTIETTQLHESASVTTDAETYIMRLKATNSSTYLTFQIAVADQKWTMTMLDVDTSPSITLTEWDGTLSFWFNYNDGDSLMGVFGSYISSSTTYEMEIFAVGNDVSVSSKSNLNKVTLLDISNLEVVDGVFSWTTTNAASTTIQYNSGGVEVNTFTLRSEDLFTYSLIDSEVTSGGKFSISFIAQGWKDGANVYVDSSMYTFAEVYNFASPKLSVELGQISIDGSENDIYFDSVYRGSSSNYTYTVTNNNASTSTGSTSTVLTSDEAEVLYEVGTTNLVNSDSDPQYEYKKTELQARQFSVSVLGTEDSDGQIVYTQGSGSSYYVKTASIKGYEDLAFALTSTTTSIDAIMLDTVTRLTVTDGIFTWDKVTGRTGGFEYSIDDGYTVVYKVLVERYNINEDETTNVLCTDVIYTTQNSFDPSLLERQTSECTYLQVTVQAFAAVVSETAPTSGNYESLLEGGYVYGYATYAKGTYYVLMGNGMTVSSVVRIPSVDAKSITVNSDGKLTWTLDISSYINAGFISSADDFGDYFEFVVLDANGDVVDGTYRIEETSEGSGELEVVFTESTGAFASGTQEISLYVNLKSGVGASYKFAKSYTTSGVSITKFAAVSGDDFEVVTSGDLEWISFEKFFSTAENVNAIVTMTIDGETFTFTNSEYKLYVSTEEQTYGSQSGFISSESGSAYVIIASSVQFSFVVSGRDASGMYCLTSDESETFAIVRAVWDSDAEVSWDETLQQFSWEYPWKALESSVSATVYSASFVSETSLYSDSNLENEAISLSGDLDGTVIILSVGTNSTKVMFESEIYYVANDAISISSTGETATLSADNLFTVISDDGQTSVICTALGEFYAISSSAVVDPEFVVQIKYQSESSARTYTVSGTTFQPSIVDTITAFSLQISFGSRQLESGSLNFEFETTEEGVQYVTMSLFESGDGTEDNPYIISTAEQFLNIEKRMTKASYLTSDEEEIYHFEISLDEGGNARTFDLGTTTSGIVLSGEFSGILVGNGATITFASTAVQTLEESVTITSSQTKVSLSSSGSDSIVYTTGSALFERFSSTASVSGLVIEASYSSASAITTNTLVSGLVVTNAGTISDVTVSKFDMNFLFSLSNSNVVAYSGIASINSGTISACSLDGDLSISSSNESQVICIGGIAYTNFGTITNCDLNGDITVNKAGAYGSLQVGSIASVVANSGSSASLTRCWKKGAITLSCDNATNTITCYAGLYAAWDFTSGGVTSNVISGVDAVVTNNISNLVAA